MTITTPKLTFEKYLKYDDGTDTRDEFDKTKKIAGSYPCVVKNLTFDKAVFT
ncbi:hypothetical protein [Nostoc sp.]